MSIFATIAGVMSGGAGKVGRGAVSGIRGVLAGCAKSERRRQAAFAVASDRASAKMAMADGVVTRPEVDAFCRMFSIPAGEGAQCQPLYNLAKRDIAGFEAYARDVARLFTDDQAMLEDFVDGLFEIAKADGAVHEREARLPGARRRTVRLRCDRLHPHSGPSCDWRGRRSLPGLVRRPLLGLRPAGAANIGRLVAEHHPDRVIARGVPEEFVRIANDRLAAINSAWARIEAMRAPVRA
jgi:DnaJ like chaperone protein